MTLPIGQVGTWKEGPTGWVIYASHRVLTEALRDDLPVRVRARDGEETEERIEHVTSPNFDDFAYGWPVGTQAGTFIKTEIPQAPHREQQLVQRAWSRNERVRAHRRNKGLHGRSR